MKEEKTIGEIMVYCISTGHGCNNNCVMCVVLRDDNKKFEKICTEDIFRQIDRMPEDEKEIVLTDGEPTIRDDIFDIIEYIRKHRPDASITIVTNGRMFYYGGFSDRMASFKNVRMITEIHDGSREMHDRITGCEGSFEQTVAGIKNILGHGGDVEIRVLMHKMNYCNLEATAKFISSHFSGVSRVVFFPIDLVGNARKNIESLAISLEEIMPYLEKAIDILKNDFDVKIYHIPYCKIQKGYRDFVYGKTVEDARLFFAGDCESCAFYRSCPGLWKTYAKHVSSLVGLTEVDG